MAFLPDHAFDLIRRSRENGRLAHAYLLHGPDAEAVRSLAVKVASLVNGWEGLHTLDDLRARGAFIVEPESKSRIIKVAQMRNLEDELHLTSFTAAVKVAVISDCDRLREESANAFLKTLEEPPSGTLILLLTVQPDSLLPTIRSRCVRVSLYASEQHGIALDDEQSRVIELVASHFTRGEPSPSRALNLLHAFQAELAVVKDRVITQHEEALDDEKQTYQQRTDGAWLRSREDYYDNLTEALYQEQRNRLLALLYAWFGEILRRQQGLPALSFPGYDAVTASLAASMPARDLHKRIRAIEELRSNLATTVREPLALEVAFLKAFG